jgi:hypothetical protein
VAHDDELRAAVLWWTVDALKQPSELEIRLEEDFDA